MNPSDTFGASLSMRTCVRSSSTHTYVHDGAVQAQVDAQYRALSRQRNQMASTKTRLMKVIDDPRSLRSLGRQNPLTFKKKVCHSCSRSKACRYRYKS